MEETWSEELDSVKCKVLGKLERERKKRSGKGKRRKRQARKGNME